MSANRWYKDSTLARDCQGCTSKIHALAIACRKIPHTIGNKAAAREIPARPVTPHPSRKASGFPQAQRRKRPPFARHPPKPEGRQFFTGATRKKAPSRPVTPPKPEGLRFPQAQRERRPRPGHPTQTGRAAIFRRRNAKEGPRSRAPPKPDGRWFPAGTTQKKTPVRAAPAQTRGAAVFRRHVAKKGPRSRGARPNQKAGNFPQARRGKRPRFARIPKRKRPERRVSRRGDSKESRACPGILRQTRRAAIFHRRNAEEGSLPPCHPHPSRRGGGFAVWAGLALPLQQEAGHAVLDVGGDHGGGGRLEGFDGVFHGIGLVAGLEEGQVVDGVAETDHPLAAK